MHPTALRLVLLLGLAVSSGPAAADDPPDADRLGRELTAALDGFAAGNDGVLDYGDIEVRADDAAFDVAISGLRLLPDPAGYFDVGTLRFRLRPQADDLYAVSEVQLPTALPYRGVGGETEAVLKMPSVTFAGSWSRRLQNFLAVDLAARALELRDASDIAGVSVDGLTLRVDSDETAPGRWDKFSVITIDRLRTDGEMDLSVEGLEFRSQAQGLTPFNIRNLVRELQAAQADAEPVEGGELAALLGAGSLFPDGTGRLDLQGLRLRGAQGGEILHLPQAGIDITGSGFDGDAARVDLQLQHRGLTLGQEVTGGDPLAPHLVPRDMTLDAEMEGLPGRELMGALIALVASDDRSGGPASDDAATAFGSTLWRLLRDAGSKIHLSDLALDTGTVHLEAEGMLRGDAAAARSAVAAFDIDIAGLDALIDIAAASPTGAGATPIRVLLQTLRSFGKPATSQNGTATSRYAISLSPEGMLLVNGQDLQFLLPDPPPSAN